MGSVEPANPIVAPVAVILYAKVWTALNDVGYAKIVGGALNGLENVIFSFRSVTVNLPVCIFAFRSLPFKKSLGSSFG